MPPRIGVLGGIERILEAAQLISHKVEVSASSADPFNVEHSTISQ
jgi:hypothetical protein